MSRTDRVSTNTSPRDARRRDPITVMVVDDEKDPRESVCEWLSAKGYAVVPARDGADALRQLRASDGHKPDVILLDLMMPVMNGWQFREQQTQDPQLASIPVVVITANRDTRGIQADDTLFKPLNPEHLLEVVERFCATEPSLAGSSSHASGLGPATPARRNPHRPDIQPVPARAFSERLVEMLGHDLRNPLSAIAMTSSMLASQAATPEVAEPAARILSIVERMDMMIAHLSEFLRARLGRDFVVHRNHIDITDLCNKVVNAFTASTHREIDLTLNGPLYGVWDRARLELLLATLITHAADRDQSKNPIRVRADGSNPRFVRLEVAHLGIAAVDFNSNPATEDVEAECIRLGLGMFVARHIVRAHGGVIEIETDGATAARFVIGLPRDAESD
jgi:CheY-like chemotaxis protein